MTPLTVIVWPATETTPVEAVVYPALLEVVDGALQPAGAVTVTSPFDIPPAAAVYVNVSVLPVEPLPAFAGSTVSVPEPFAALIVIDGDGARFVNTPAAVERSWPCQVCAPVAAVAVAPAPPPAFEPYVMVAVAPPASVRAETVIVCAATATVPALEVV